MKPQIQWRDRFETCPLPLTRWCERDIVDIRSIDQILIHYRLIANESQVMH